MFDYDSRALRPREISNPQVCGDNSCDNFLNPYYFTNTPCGAEQYPAIIDKCVITNMGKHQLLYFPTFHT